MLHSLFFENAKMHGDRCALNVSGEAYSYADLEAAALNVSRYLQSAGAEPGMRICIFAPKDFWGYSAVLGVLHAGCTYIPLEPTYPAPRLQMILERAKPKFFLVPDKIPDDLSAPANCNIVNREDFGDPREYDLSVVKEQASDGSALAYILFTSGSTGVPKGVMITHDNAEAFVSWGRKYFSVTPDDKMSGHSDLTFDLSVFDAFVAFSAGASLIPVLDMMDRASPGTFIRDNKISIWFSVPSVMSSMSALDQVSAEFLSGLRFMAFCGEPLRPSVVSMLRDACPDLRIANLYGPTEATVACSAYEIEMPLGISKQGVPIGWVTEGTGIFVWHADGRIANLGQTGEVYIYGDQVGPGYFLNEEETNKRFQDDPRGVPGKCFVTGDLAIVGEFGPVFTARKDSQIKHRGYRIELGDVEHAMASLPGVIECVAGLIPDGKGGESFIGFVRHNDKDIKPSVLMKGMNKIVPSYMVPTRIKLVDDFPRTANNKIDRKRLSELG